MSKYGTVSRIMSCAAGNLADPIYFRNKLGDTQRQVRDPTGSRTHSNIRKRGLVFLIKVAASGIKA